MGSAKTRLLCLLPLFAIIYAVGMKVDVMDVDAAQYAEISREMLSSGQYLQVHDLGQDYLDKPPFTFWACSLSMRIFGINNFAYKLPSLLFALLAIWSVFGFARIYYREPVAELSALVLASCQGMFLMTNDCRTDTILMGAVAFAIWQFANWDRSGKLSHLILASAGIGIGMLTKGPVALMVPLFAFIPEFLLKRQLRKIFRPHYFVAILVIALLLLPMCIGLYRQFDLHPEKIVNGQTGVSGLKFFFWTQSFGRITGASQWNNHAGIFFLLQNMLWTFFPWIFFFLAGLGRNLFIWIKLGLRVPQGEEFITTAGFVLTYLSLGLSHYQLPHYIFIVFPLAAVITAKFICECEIKEKWKKIFQWMSGLQYLLLGLALVLSTALLIFVFPPHSIIPWLWISGVIVVFILLLIRAPAQKKLIRTSLFILLAINVFLSSYFYPHLLQYQMGTMAGRWVQQHHIPANKFFVYGISNHSRSLNFYSQRIVPSIPDTAYLEPGDYFLTGELGYQELIKKKHDLELVLVTQDYPVSLLNSRFLYYKTRSETIKPYYLVRIP